MENFKYIMFLKRWKNIKHKIVYYIIINIYKNILKLFSLLMLKKKRIEAKTKRSMKNKNLISIIYILMIKKKEIKN